jgi:hypothetical protein
MKPLSVGWMNQRTILLSAEVSQVISHDKLLLNAEDLTDEFCRQIF